MCSKFYGIQKNFNHDVKHIFVGLDKLPWDKDFTQKLYMALFVFLITDVIDHNRRHTREIMMIQYLTKI